MTEFTDRISQEQLNISDKNRSNCFTWRGQFSPQLVEVLLKSYCPPGGIVLDPFAGSGTVLLESAVLGHESHGIELNPAAFILSKVYELVNHKEKDELAKRFQASIDKFFPVSIFENEKVLEDLSETILEVRKKIDQDLFFLYDALIILLDIAKNEVTNSFIHLKARSIIDIIRSIPFSQNKLKVHFSDARAIELNDNYVDFVITSPPYINVFNYHQNYRKSAEVLGWDLLKVARSEIGSNRANRGNRFFTVIQYCLDMADILRELSRVTRQEGRIIFVVGHESNVLGVPFYNADIIEKIAVRTDLFDLVLSQKREFKNKFGKIIREDILNFQNKAHASKEVIDSIAREVAFDVLKSGLNFVPEKNLPFLEDAIEKVDDIGRTQKLNVKSSIPELYIPSFSQNVLSYSKSMPELPRPHFQKLEACLLNPRTPDSDKSKISLAIEKYHEWISNLESVERGKPDTVQKLVNFTNAYKRFIELDLIFDSSENFLYRQKGQLKLDNTILEEFLPQLAFRGLSGVSNDFELGPRKTFAGLSFLSSIGELGNGGLPSLRSKDQDFILGKKLYLKSSFDPDFAKHELIESHLGYVCVECKTNLDKTMFQEAVATSRDLKIAVPGSLYFLICEFLDMKPSSTVSTQIDGVLIVRKQKRMAAGIRQEYKTPESRQTHRDDYVAFLDSSKYSADVFQRMIDKIQVLIDDKDPSADKVLKRGYF